jgi:hypothetical protein
LLKVSTSETGVTLKEGNEFRRRTDTSIRTPCTGQFFRAPSILPMPLPTLGGSMLPPVRE